MKIDITSIIRKSGGTIPISRKEYIETMGTELGIITFTSPVDFSGSVTNFNGMLLLKGIARLTYTTQCDRCGDKIENELVVDINEEIIERAEAETEAENDFENDRFTFNGNMLELDRILADVMITAIPMSHLCREDCPGLCSLCGSENGKSCSCNNTDSVDSRFEALKGFFD